VPREAAGAREVGRAAKPGGRDKGIGGVEQKRKERVGPTFWRWELRAEGMENGGRFKGSAGVVFLYEASKFWSIGPYRGPCWSCSY
jgi:hypothetical protein